MKAEMTHIGTSGEKVPVRYLSTEERWTALLNRDQAADGRFLYSVRTTGIYCRPSCASRLPRRENVRFHNSCNSAESAGFRPCKRCHPDALSLPQLHAKKVAAACRMIEGAVELPDLGTLAKSAGVSRFHFHRLFTKMTGLTPKAYAVAHRENRMRELLPKRGSVTEAIYETGFNSNSRFYEKSSEMLGMTPKVFRSGGRGETIRFTTASCSLGFVLVAFSEKGVCAIFLGDHTDGLWKALRDRFPGAKLIEGAKGFKKIVSRVVRLIEEPGIGLNLPLDVRGTAFQQRVWKALQAIPSGSTASYAAIAARIKMPKAVRAVAGACAANPVAVIIPCHRVVCSDGKLSGYRWGVERKRSLLARESKP
jgi:AraC family transcriptional regulator, regulatory protein of adaptative response / methylated-DNA-[protein]-cysteine methyltransferase